MSDVKILIAGTDALGTAKKGDVIDVVGSASDWGSRTVTPNWIRLIITGIPGSQEVAENLVRGYLTSWKDKFLYRTVSGAIVGKQRYRIEISSDVVGSFDMSTKKEIREKFLEEFDGVLVNQSKNHIEFDSYPEIPIEAAKLLMSSIAYRRFCFPQYLVDAVLAGAVSGQPVLYYRTISWVRDNIIDKLKI